MNIPGSEWTLEAFLTHVSCTYKVANGWVKYWLCT